MSSSCALRFRHTSGDVGPFTVATASSIGALKDKLLAEWPSEGPLAAERPDSVSEIKLIGAGTFLDNAATLSSLPHVLGAPGSGIIVTLHVVLRKPLPPKAAASKQQPEQSKGCCVIS